MGLNVDEDLKRKLKGLVSAEWKQKQVRYLGIKCSDNVQELVEDNILPYMNKLKNQLEHWQKLKIS